MEEQDNTRGTVDYEDTHTTPMDCPLTLNGHDQATTGFFRRGKTRSSDTFITTAAVNC